MTRPETSHRCRVLHIITGLYTGGAENMLRKLVIGMDPRFDNLVISLRDPGPMVPLLKKAGVAVECLDMPAGRPTLPGLRKLDRLAKQFQPTVVQGWMYHGNLAASAVQKRLAQRVPVAWNVRQTLALSSEKPASRVVVNLNKRLSRAPAAIIYNSAVSASQHESYGFCSKERRIIPNGVDTELYKPDAAARMRIRKELSISDQAPVVGVIARLHPIKDHPTFVQVAAKIREAVPDCRFLVAGAGTDDSKELEQLVTDAGFCSRSFLRLGERSDIPGIMASLDVLMVTSCAVEGFPNVVIEAMASGTRCVVTDIGDSRAVVGDTGTVAAPKDVQALAKGAIDFIRSDLLARERGAKQARQRVIDCYTIGAVTDQYEALYDHLVATENREP